MNDKLFWIAIRRALLAACKAIAERYDLKLTDEEKAV